MPIYEYECSNCHHQFELIQKINDEPARQCPQCFEESAVRLISSAGFRLVGSGWYESDYKKKPADAGAPTSKPEVKDKTNTTK